MNDQEYLADCIKSCNTVFSSYAGEAMYVKDADFRFQQMSNKMMGLIGVSTVEEYKDKTTAELKLIGEKFMTEEKKLDFVEQFKKQDGQVKTTKKLRICLEIMPGDEKPAIFVTYKTPIINPETNNFVGLRGQINPFVLPHAVKLLFKIHGTKGLLLNSENTKRNSWKDYPLTNMQYMVLFLCINNYSYSEIALLMTEFGNKISANRVNEYLEQLKLIFHVRTKNQLIEKAIGLNFHLHLPYDLFKLSSIDITEEAARIIYF